MNLVLILMNREALDYKTLHFTSDRNYVRICKESRFFTSCISTREIWVLFCLLFAGSFMALRAQGIIDTNLQIRNNDPTVTVTVTNKNGHTNPQAGDNITITLNGLPTGKQAEVKAGNSFSDGTLGTWTIQSDNSSFTFEMPAYKLFIDINVQYLKTPEAYSLTVETTGLSSAKVTVGVAGDNITATNSPYQVKPTTSVTASLPASLPERVSLLGIEGSAPDGSWFLNPVVSEGSPYPGRITFTMPATDVVLRFIFKEEAAPGPGPDTPDPSPGPDEPDEPDNPDPDPVANEQIPDAGIRLRTSEGVLYIRTGSPATACIYTFSGELIREVSLGGGEEAVSLPRHLYIVRIAGQSFKISL